MPIHEKKECEGLKENTKLELDIYSDRIRERAVARVFLHVTHGPAFWNDAGRKITFSLNDIIISEEITDKDGRCMATVYDIPGESEKAVLLIHAEESMWTTPCEISVSLWEKIDEQGNTVIYSKRVPTPDEKEKEQMPAWERALMGSAAIIALGMAGYLLISGTLHRKV